MKTTSRSIVSLLVLSLSPCMGWASAQAGYIAGIRPWERPEQAPRITEVHHGGAWYRRALTGVVPPYPASLRFLEDQGNWYTPFNHPGMYPPYDIRGWHRGADAGE